jgi:oligoendopeptidase F
MTRTLSRFIAWTLVLAVPFVVSAERPTTMVREEIADRFKWDLAQIYPSWEVWEVDLGASREAVSAFSSHRGTLAESAEHLAAALRARDEMLAAAEKVWAYAYLRWVEDTRRQDVQERLDLAKGVLSDAQAAASWLEPELTIMPEEKVTSWIDTTASLTPYAFTIAEVFRKRAHALDAEGEQLLSLFAPVSSSLSALYDAATVADAQFPEVTLADGRTIRATGSSSWQSLNRDRLQRDRRAVYEGYIGVFDGREKTLAGLYGAVLQRNWAMAKARGYDNCLQATLDEFAIPAAVYDTLIKTAYEGAEPLRRYHQLRRNVLGLESYHDYDRRVPLVETSVSFSYENIRQPLLASVAPLGEPYQREVASFFTEKRIDVYENEGKQPRNFALTVYGFPAFLKLNYGDTMEDAFMLAHEMGHGMHGNLTRRNQLFDTYEYSTFVAETASIFNEALLHDQLLASTDEPELQIAVLQYRIDTIAMAFYEIALLADFERRAHGLVEQGQPVNAEILQKLYLDRYATLYSDAMDEPELIRNAWMTWVHLFFDRPFYLFQYATSLAASTALHAQVVNGPEEQRAAAVDRYLDMLRSGASDHPIALLRRAGVDLTDPDSLGALVDEMDVLVTRLESSLADAGLLRADQPAAD